MAGHVRHVPRPAVTLIFGIAVSTLLTLAVIPVLYYAAQAGILRRAAR